MRYKSFRLSGVSVLLVPGARGEARDPGMLVPVCCCADGKIMLSTTVDYQDIMTIEPGKRGGRPCIRHKRISVADVLGGLASASQANYN